MGTIIRWTRRLLGLPPRWADLTAEERRLRAQAWADQQMAHLVAQAEHYGLDPRTVLGEQPRADLAGDPSS